MPEPTPTTTPTTTCEDSTPLPPTTPPPTPPQQETFHVDLHAWMEAQQTSHGVRHDDYTQYHGYCTRRLSRLSHLPDAKKHLVCSAKFATVKDKDKVKVKPEGGGSYGNNKTHRHAYCSRKLDTLHHGEEEEMAQHVPHVNVLWYLLVLSERAWAHAHQLQKQPSQQQSQQPQGGRRQQVLKKLKKAKGWADLLLQKATVCGDATTQQECQAYASWMTANYALETLDYQTACQEYAKAMTLCHELSQLTVDGEDADDAKRLERQDLFLTRADTVLRPLFRYCQYELKQAGEALMEEPRLSSRNSNSAATAETSIVFRGQELVLESKELRVVMLKLQSMLPSNISTTPGDSNSSGEDSKEEDDDETAFLNVLSVLDDALEVVQGILSGLEQAQVVGPAVQARRQTYLLWKGYLQSQKTQRVMDHTARLLQDITGHAERVHVYDALLQHAKSLLQLPRPTALTEEEDDEFALQVQANMLRLRALKTYHMAWYYYQQPQNYKAAWALLEQSTKLSKRAQEEIAASDEDMPNADVYLKELEGLQLKSCRCAIQAAWYLQEGSAGRGDDRSDGSSNKNGEDTDENHRCRRRRNTNRPLLLRLKDNDAGTVLAGDLMLMPIPCKPVFYDLAYHHAMVTVNSLDTIQTFLDEHSQTVRPESLLSSEPETAAKSASLLGWLTGSN